MHNMVTIEIITGIPIFFEILFILILVVVTIFLPLRILFGPFKIDHLDNLPDIKYQPKNPENTEEKL